MRAGVVALGAAAGDRRRAFRKCERVGRTIDPSRVVFFAERDLLGGEVPRAGDRGPSGRCVPAAHELLILGRVAGPAIGRCEMPGDREAAVSDLGLSRNGRVTVEATDALGRMHAHLILMYDGGGLVPMALGALARRPYERCRRLAREQRSAAGRISEARASGIEHECRNDECGSERYGDKDGFERHTLLLHFCPDILDGAALRRNHPSAVQVRRSVRARNLSRQIWWSNIRC